MAHNTIEMRPRLSRTGPFTGHGEALDTRLTAGPVIEGPASGHLA